MTKQDYFAARRLLRDNGKCALRWMRMREASVMMRLMFAPEDKLAEKLLISKLF